MLPARLAMMNMDMPSFTTGNQLESPCVYMLSLRTCHLLRLNGGRRRSFGSFSSSNMCDLRCSVRPSDCTEAEISPTRIPTWNAAQMSTKSPCNGGKYVPQHYPEETDLLSFPCYRMGIMDNIPVVYGNSAHAGEESCMVGFSACCSTLCVVRW